MKAYVLSKKDDNCCPGHAKYGRSCSQEMNRPRKSSKNLPRKKKARRINKKIEL